MEEKSLYKPSAKYYDLLVDKKEIEKEANFISKILRNHKVKSVLDIGCGTGLYLLPLKKNKFLVEGLDLSKEMLKEARKKDKAIKLHNQDMSTFELNENFDSIICLSSSLLALPNFRLIEKSLKKMYKHLNQGGILFLDMPNHIKEIKECDNIEEKESKKFRGGVLNSTFLSYKKGKKWREEWYGEVKKRKNIFKFKDLWEELIYSPVKLELVLKKIGFEIIEKYGSMKGDKFDKKNSWRRIYICKKKD